MKVPNQGPWGRLVRIQPYVLVMLGSYCQAETEDTWDYSHAGILIVFYRNMASSLAIAVVSR